MDAQSGVNFVLSANIKWGFYLLCFSMEGGELFSRIQERGDQAFTERGETSSLWKIFFLSSPFLCPLFPFRIFFFDFIYGGVCCCYYCYLTHCVLRVIMNSSWEPGIIRIGQVQVKCGRFREKSFNESAQLFHFCTMWASVPLLSGLVPGHLCHDQCSSCCDLSLPVPQAASLHTVGSGV